MSNEILGLVTNLLKDVNLTDTINNLAKDNPNIEKNMNVNNSANLIIQRIEKLEQQLIEKESVKEAQLSLLIQEIQETKNLILANPKQKNWFFKLFKR